jgi:hypothetical protein
MSKVKDTFFSVVRRRKQAETYGAAKKRLVD